MKQNVYLLFFLLSYLCYSQSKSPLIVYLDETKKEITKPYYDLKCKTYVLKCQKYQTKDVTIYKVNNRYKFGRIKPLEYNQIRTLIATDSKTKIENDKVIIIKYSDTLINYERALKNRKKHYKTYHNQVINQESYSKKRFNKRRQHYVKNKFKCVEDYEKKYSTKIIHVYKHGDDAKESYGQLNMLKDRGIIKRLFFNNIRENHIVILKPNGDYLLVGGHLSDKDLGKLVKDKDWSDYKSQLNLSINTKKAFGYGVFKKVSGHHKKHCF